MALVIGLIIILGKDGATGSENEAGPEQQDGLLNALFGGRDSSNDERGETPSGSQDVEDSNNGSQTNATSQGRKLDLVQLTDVAVSGYIATSTEDGDKVRYIERASGNVFQVDPRSLITERLTNTTIPGVHEALWHKNAERVVLRYVNDNGVIKTYMADIVPDPNSSEPDEFDDLDGSFLEDEISEMEVSPQNDKLVYIEKYAVWIKY